MITVVLPNGNEWRFETDSVGVAREKGGDWARNVCWPHVHTQGPDWQTQLEPGPMPLHPEMHQAIVDAMRALGDPWLAYWKTKKGALGPDQDYREDYLQGQQHWYMLETIEYGGSVEGYPATQMRFMKVPEE